MRAVLLAGGRASRLGPRASDIPKALMQISGRTLIDMLLACLRQAGFSRVTLCVGHLEGDVRAYVGDGSAAGVSVDYVSDGGELGTAGPLGLLSDWDEPVLALNADLVTDISFDDMFAVHERSGAAITLAVREHISRFETGVVQCDPNGRVGAVIEKPEFRNLQSLGVYVIDPQVRSRLPLTRRIDMPDLINDAINAGYDVRTYEHRGHWHDIGTPSDLRAAESTLLADPAAFGLITG